VCETGGGGEIRTPISAVSVFSINSAMDSYQY